MKPINLALLQINLVPGNLAKNREHIFSGVKQAVAKGAGLCIAPELALTGSPLYDIVSYPWFLEKTEKELQILADTLHHFPALLLGLPVKGVAGEIYNAVVLINKGSTHIIGHKTCFSCFGGYDESRYFQAGEGFSVFTCAGVSIALTMGDAFKGDVQKGADLIVHLGNTPFYSEEYHLRKQALRTLAQKSGTFVAHVNQTGGFDNLVFSGQSMIFSGEGTLLAEGKAFEEDVIHCSLQGEGLEETVPAERESRMWQALVLGLRDYVQKCSFKKGVLGLSGGVDSAFVAAIAQEALGSENVLGVLMPAPWSSSGSIDDSLLLAKNLGIETKTLPVDTLIFDFEKVLAETFSGLPRDVTEENIQPRIRGTLLMALANKFGYLLLATGNKSEAAVGYCTIYGDMCGGVAPIADLWKTEVYALCHWFNNQKKQDIIPQNILAKPPSAELTPGQRDDDSLPCYAVLDPILTLLMEKKCSVLEVAARGFDIKTVEYVAKLVKGAEFKRKQAPCALAVSRHAVKYGWDMPVACSLP